VACRITLRIIVRSFYTLINKGNIMKKSFSVSSIIIAAILAASTSAQAAKLAGAQGTMDNIKSALNSTVRTAERLYEENNGQSLIGGYKTVEDGKNPYLQHLKINEQYHIEIQLDGNANKVGNNTSSPVAKSLLGAQILLIPIYNSGDELITSWECVTNADLKTQGFMGDKGTKEFSASFIRDYTSNPYLSKCIFVRQDDILSGSSGIPGR